MAIVLANETREDENKRACSTPGRRIGVGTSIFPGQSTPAPLPPDSYAAPRAPLNRLCRGGRRFCMSGVTATSTRGAGAGSGTAPEVSIAG